MNISVLQHVPYEGPGRIKTWANISGHKLEIFDATTSEFEQLPLNRPLIILGGPMSVYDRDKFDFIDAEIDYIKRVMAAGMPILGICLGAQLIAASLGARVYPNAVKEIGWFPVGLTPRGKMFNDLSHLFKSNSIVFHWHGDTFDIPIGADHLFMTNDCLNQGFIFKERVIGLQFHLEVGRREAMEMVRHGLDEITNGGTRVQSLSEISSLSHQHNNDRILVEILDKWLYTKLS